MRKEFLVFLVAVSLISSCKRNGSQDDVPQGSASIVGKAQSWIERQKKLNVSFGEKIQQLSGHVEWSLAKLESFANRNLLVVPIKQGYLTLNNKGNDPSNYLVLFVNQQQEISTGRIVQYVNPRAKTPMPENAIVKILNNDDPGCEGSFSFTNIVDRFLYELKFSSGKKTDFVYMRPKAESTRDAGKLLVQCHDWYLITRHYNDDGTVEVWEDYLGRTCDGCTPLDRQMEGTVCDQFLDGSGGGAETQECCMLASNATLETSSVASDLDRSCGTEAVDPATGRLTKTCYFSWTYNTSTYLWSTWRYRSMEMGELERFGPLWKFKTFVHVSKSREGDADPACVRFTDGIENATVSILNDGTQARIDLTYWIEPKNSCVPFVNSNKQTMTSYANFNATVF